MINVDRAYIVETAKKYANYPIPKWLKFCSAMLGEKFRVELYPSHSTVSKYIYVTNPRNGKQVKVRFSDHKPNWKKEVVGDADFYAGVSNCGVTTTERIIPEVIRALS